MKILTEGATDYLAAIGPLRFPRADVIGFPGVPFVRKGVEELLGRKLVTPADEIVIALDGDAAGDKAAEEAAEVLSNAGITTRRLRPPEPHKDLCGWSCAIQMAGGDPAESIREALRNSELRDPFAWAVPASTFVERTQQDTQWLVRDLVPRGAFVVLVSAPGTGKTWISIHLAASVSNRQLALGDLDVEPGRVVLVEEEGNPGALAERLTLLGAANDEISVAHRAGVSIDNKNWVDRLITLCRVRRISLLILDPLAELHGGDENEAQAIGLVVRAVNRLRREVDGLSVLLLHHVPKAAYEATEGSRAHARGSSALVGAADVQIELIGIEPLEHDGARSSLAFRLEVVKARDFAAPDPVECALFLEAAGAEFRFKKVRAAEIDEEKAAEDASALDKRVYALIPDDGSLITQGDLRKVLKIGTTKLRESLERLEALGLIVRSKRGIARRPAVRPLLISGNA